MFASLRSLYYETGWEALADRRKRRKLTLMYKSINGDAPSYLIDLLPNRENDINTKSYSLGNRNEFIIPFSTLCSYGTSYFPSN